MILTHLVSELYYVYIIHVQERVINVHKLHNEHANKKVKFSLAWKA